MNPKHETGEKRSGLLPTCSNQADSTHVNSTPYLQRENKAEWYSPYKQPLDQKVFLLKTNLLIEQMDMKNLLGGGLILIMMAI